MSPKSKSATPVLATKHKDKRANIPTEELRDFVADDEKTPRNILYPRDPSLDPQLVWKGKDEQDRHPLEVPAVPIYIQEKIKPQAIIELVREGAQSGRPQQFDFYGDFNGIKFEQLIEFYQHKDGVNWANRMILGDSLLVMTSLAEKEGLKGQVQMIYIDPPYGIKFGSNWQVSTRKRDVKDGKAEDATRQPEQIRASPKAAASSSKSAMKMFISSDAFWMRYLAAKITFRLSHSRNRGKDRRKLCP